MGKGGAAGPVRPVLIEISSKGGCMGTGAYKDGEMIGVSLKRVGETVK